MALFLLINGLVERRELRLQAAEEEFSHPVKSLVHQCCLSVATERRNCSPCLRHMQTSENSKVTGGGGNQEEAQEQGIIT